MVLLVVLLMQMLMLVGVVTLVGMKWACVLHPEILLLGLKLQA